MTRSTPAQRIAPFAALAALVLGLLFWSSTAIGGVVDAPTDDAHGTADADAAAAAELDAGARGREAGERPAEPPPLPGGDAAKPSAAPPSRDDIVVRVVDVRDGKPVANAKVAANKRDYGAQTAGDRAAMNDLRSQYDRDLRFGQTATTDGDGCARLQFVPGMTVGAAKGDLFGQAFVATERIGPAGFELQVAPVRVVAVRVVGPDRKPRPGVPLGIALHYPNGELQDETLEAEIGVADADGELRFRFEEFARPGAPPVRAEVFVDAPGQLARYAALPPDATRVDLVLADACTLRVRVLDCDGTALADEPAWSVRIRSSTEEESPVVTRPSTATAYGSGGEAVFQNLGPCAQVRLWLECGGYTVHKDVAGPTHMGEEVVLTIALGDLPHFRASGRAVAEDGTALANTPLSLRSVDANDDHRARTDAEGRFVVHFDRRDDGAASFVLVADPPEGGALASEPQAVRRGAANDLGAVVLRPLRPLVTGTIVARHGMPPGVEIAVEYEDERGWHGLSGSVTRFPGADRFAIFAAMPPRAASMRLRATAPTCVPTQPIPFAAGQDLTVEFARGARFCARLLLDPAVSWFVESSGLDIVLTDAFRNNEDDEDPHYISGTLLGGEWWFESNTVPPGIYNLAVESGRAFDDLAHLEGLRLEPDAPPDPRFQPWDLRSTVRLQTVRAIRADGNRVECYGGIQRRRRVAGDWEPSGDMENGIAQFLATAEPVDLYVDLDDQGAFLLTGVRDAVNLVVPQAIEAKVHLDGMPPQPEEPAVWIEVLGPPSWGQKRGFPSDKDPVLSQDWDREKALVQLRVFEPCEATIVFHRSGSNDDVIARVPCAIPQKGGELHIAVPDAVRAACGLPATRR